MQRTASANIDYSLAAYDYELPPERIAQNPVTPRDSSRLLVVNTPSSHNHHIFRDLPDLLSPGDLLVLNNTRVIPARLYGRKFSSGEATGAEVEVLLLEEQKPLTWLALVKPGKRLKLGARISFTTSNPSGDIPPLTAQVVGVDAATGGRILEFELPEFASFWQLLEVYGTMPLPPYIKDSQASPSQYQTIYAQQPGSAAAPTAGLHFTEELLERLHLRGINTSFVTLNVGVGTFRPVEVEDVTTHKMHYEWVDVPPVTVAQIQETRNRGGRIIAVGTTVVRSLESLPESEGQLQPFRGKTDLFIYPGYQWRLVEGLITNFHLPRSSLLMLVSALVGRERLLDLYREAIGHQYRFYSFGDAMLILPTART